MIAFDYEFENGARKTHVVFDPEWLAESPVVFNKKLAAFCSQVCTVGYYLPAPETDPVESDSGRFLKDFGMEKIFARSLTAFNEEDCIFGRRTVTVAGEEVTLLLVSLQGTYSDQWYDNFDPGLGRVHKGYTEAADFVLKNLTSLAEGTDPETVKVIVTGHSRGAAVSNLMAASIIDEGTLCKRENLFTYTFAAPGATMDENVRDPKYDGIFNIMNTEDFVTKCMQPEWGYSRYGHILNLPRKAKTDEWELTYFRMNEVYKKYNNGATYYPFKKGSEIVDNLFDEMSGTVDGVEEYYSKKFPVGDEEYSLYEYFQSSLCKIVASPEGSETNVEGTKLLTSAVTKGGLFASISKFFIGYEGLAGATGGKISKKYFSMAHDISTYSSFLLTDAKLTEVTND